MIIVSGTQFHVYLPWGQHPFSIVSCSVLNVIGVEAAFNQEKALVGAFSVITNLRMELFEALAGTSASSGPALPSCQHQVRRWLYGGGRDPSPPTIRPCLQPYCARRHLLGTSNPRTHQDDGLLGSAHKKIHAHGRTGGENRGGGACARSNR